MTLLRTESFVPLTTLPAANENREFRVTVAPLSAQSRPLQSMDPVPERSSNGESLGRTCEPRVSLQCDGDRISSIRVQCSCGQVMDLACVYEPASRTS